MEVSGRTADTQTDTVTETTIEEPIVSCDPCSIDGQQLPVAGFCVDCQHYLCETCYNYHCRPLPSRHHVLLDRNTMPQQRNTILVEDSSTEKCMIHKHKSVKYFCKPHDHVGCSVCITTNHKACDDVSYIADVSTTIEESTEFKTFIKNINETKEQFEFNKNKSGHNILYSKTCFRNIIADVRKLRHDINKRFDEIENEIEREANTIKESTIEKMSHISATCDEAIKYIQALNSDLEMLMNSKKYQQLFIKMKKTQLDIKKMKGSLAKVTDGNEKCHYVFVPDEQINNTLKNLKAFGQLKLKKHEDLQWIHVQDIKINSSSGGWITGSTHMSNGQFAFTDLQNNTVRLYNTIQNEVTSKLKLSSNPWDITETNQGELAVTLYNTKQIQFVAVSDTLSADRVMKVNGECMGIACYKDKLAVTFSNPAKVEIMEMNGTVLNIISTDTSGVKLFVDPRYIAISPELTALHVSDFENKSVTSLTLNGEVRATYRDLDNPTGVCDNSDGVIYVCGYNSHNVYQIMDVGDKSQILLKQTVVVKLPWSIACSNHDNKIYIGMEKSNIVKVYDLR